MNSKVNLFGGGKAVCRVLKLKKYSWAGKPSRKRFEISYIDPINNREKIARYPLHRLEFCDFEKEIFKNEILSFYDENDL